MDDNLEKYSSTYKKNASPIQENILCKHLLVELYDFKQDKKNIKADLFKFAEIVCGTAIHSHFEELGSMYSVRGFIMLKESHISIHTWPEHKYAALDIFMCILFSTNVVKQEINTLFKTNKMLLKSHFRGRNYYD